MGFITEEGLKNLKNYKYVSGGYSFLDKIFNHWWEFFVKLIPMVLNSSCNNDIEHRPKPYHTYWIGD
jgi:hypothetical protein